MVSRLHWQAENDRNRLSCRVGLIVNLSIELIVFPRTLEDKNESEEQVEVGLWVVLQKTC